MILGLGCLTAAGCKTPPEAPEDLDEAIHYFWTDWQTATNEELAVAVGALDTMIDHEALDKGRIDGLPTYLSEEEANLVPTEHELDPTTAHPLFMIHRVRCDIEQLDRVLYHLDQQDLFGAYDRYDRQYTKDLAAYQARTASELEWEIELDATLPVSVRYTEFLIGGLRWMPPTDIEGAGPAADNPVILDRTWMTKPSVFENPAKTFDQDFQLEVWYVGDDGDIVHLIALWRDLDLGAGFNSGDALVQQTTLGGLESWDRDIEKLCEEGRP